MKTWRKHRFSIKCLITVLFATIVTFMVSKYIHIPHFEIDKSVDLVGLLSIFIAAFIAIYIAKIVEGDNTSKARERDLLFRRGNDIIDQVRNLRMETSDYEISHFKATAILKNISRAIQAWFNLVDICNTDLDKKLKAEIDLKYQDLRKALTYTNPRVRKEVEQTSELSLEVKENIIHMSELKFEELDKHFRELIGKLSLALLDVNRS